MIFALTSDVDFVSDAVLERAYEPFKSLPLTIFMTGKSEFLNNSVLREINWELQPHPNFCCGSTHGKNIKEVFASIENFSGAKTGFRCHRYFSSNDIEEEFSKRGFCYSSNICTDLELVSPFMDRCGIMQFPVFMEDGGFLKYHGTPHIDFIAKKFSKEGVYVFNFHPIHLALNSCDFSAIRNLKDSLTTAEYSAMTSDDIDKYSNKRYGMMNFLQKLLDFAKKNSIEFLNLGECYERYKNVRI